VPVLGQRFGHVGERRARRREAVQEQHLVAVRGAELEDPYRAVGRLDVAPAGEHVGRVRVARSLVGR